MHDWHIGLLLTYGSACAPTDWVQNYRVRMQKLYYIKSGTGWYWDADGARQPFCPGHIYLFPYNYVYQFENDPDDPLDHIFFDFRSTPPLIANRPLICTPDGKGGLLHLFEAFDEFYRAAPAYGPKSFQPAAILHAKPDAALEKKQIVHRMLTAILDLLNYYVPLPFAEDPAVCRTLEYIRENYTRQIRVSELAARAGYETNYFIKRFSAVMQQTPYAYLRAYRILIACQHLAAGATLAEAAAQSGYSDASALAHALRRHRSQTA